MMSEKGASGSKGQAVDGSAKPKVGVKAASLVPPNLTERQQLALLLKQTRTESVPVQSEESNSDQSDESSSSSSGGDNRKRRRGAESNRQRKLEDESNKEENSKEESDNEAAPSGGFPHSARLPPPIPMPRGMGKRTRVRQRRTGAGDLRPHEGSGSGEDDDDPLPVRKPEEYLSWPPAKQAAWNNLATDANAFYEKYAPPGHELDLGEWTPEEQSRFLQVLRDHPVEDDQWGLFSMHFPTRNGMQCRQLHAKLVKSGALGADGEMRTHKEIRTVSQPSAAPSRTADAQPSHQAAELPSHREKETLRRREVSQEGEEKPKLSSVPDAANLGKGARLEEREATRVGLPSEREALEKTTTIQAEDNGEVRKSEDKSERGQAEGNGSDNEKALVAPVPQRPDGKKEIAGETKDESRKETVSTTRDESTREGQGLGIGKVKAGPGGTTDSVRDKVPWEQAAREHPQILPEVHSETKREKEERSEPLVKVSTAPEKREAKSNEQVTSVNNGEPNHEALKKAVDPAPGTTTGKASTAIDETSKPTAFVRRHLAPNVTVKAPAVALALPAITKSDVTPKQFRMPNGKFGPSVQQKAEEGSGPNITLFKMVNGEKLSLTIRKREGEEPAKKRKKEMESEGPKGLTVVLGGKTVHKRKRMSDSARAGSPARERAKEAEDPDGLDATLKTTKKVRIRHPAEDPEEKRRSRGGSSALKPRALGFPPRLASNPSTPHSISEATDLQPGGMAARVSSRELQQLLPASSPAYSPLFSLASARRRDREVLMGADRFRRTPGGFEEGTPLPTGKLINACKLLTVLDKRDAKWHASAGGGWKEHAEEAPHLREEPRQGSRKTEDAAKLQQEEPEARATTPEPPSAEVGSESRQKVPPEKVDLPAERPAEAAEPPQQGADDDRAQREPEQVGEQQRGHGTRPAVITEVASLVDEGFSKLPEEIRRRRDALFAERMKLQKRWLYEYEILESGFEQLYEQAGDDEPGEEGKSEAPVQNASSHVLRPTRGQPEAANTALRGGESSQPPTPQAFTKSYVELLFERSREDLLQRYRMEADALDMWHKWLAESPGPLTHAARHALEQMPLDPRQLLGT